MGDLKFDRHIEVKDTRLANTSDIDEKLSLNTYSTVSDIIKDFYPDDLQKFVEEPSDLQDDYEYPRNGTDPGLVVIFNHESYLDSTLQFREGSRRDVNELIQSFGRVGYNIEKNYIHNDLTRKEILNVLEAISKEDHTERNCLIVIFLSHGEDSNKLHVNDGYITTTEIWQNFASCPTLQNKPKLFVFQACKGTNVSYAFGNSEHNENINLIPADTFTISFAPDMLIVYAAVEGNSSYRHTLKGSWFIQEFCKNVLAYGRREDVVSIVTRTTKAVANTYFERDEELPNFVGKQMPLFISTLRKRFYLTRSKDRSLLLSLIQQHNNLADTVQELREKVDVLYKIHLKEKKSTGGKQ